MRVSGAVRNNERSVPEVATTDRFCRRRIHLLRICPSCRTCGAVAGGSSETNVNPSLRSSDCFCKRTKGVATIQKKSPYNKCTMESVFWAVLSLLSACRIQHRVRDRFRPWPPLIPLCLQSGVSRAKGVRQPVLLHLKPEGGRSGWHKKLT
jgi:hypothetical protein